jgi:Group II intron, maturase-specific domain
LNFLRVSAIAILLKAICPRYEGKTLITHIDEGLDFLGWRIQRHRKRGTSRHYVYVYPSGKAVQAMKRKIKTLCRQVAVNQPLENLLRRVNQALRGWCGYFRHGVSSAVFLPQLLHVANGLALAAAQTPPGRLEAAAPPLLRRRLVASRTRTASCSTPPRCAPTGTATAARSYPAHGPRLRRTSTRP